MVNEELKEILSVGKGIKINNLFYADMLSCGDKIGIAVNGIHILNVFYGSPKDKFNGDYLIIESTNYKMVMRLCKVEKNKYKLISNCNFENIGSKEVVAVNEFSGEKKEVYIKAIDFIINSKSYT